MSQEATQPTGDAGQPSAAAQCSAALHKVNECGNWLLGVREYVIARKLNLALGRVICLQSALDELKVILSKEPPNSMR